MAAVILVALFILVLYAPDLIMAVRLDQSLDCRLLRDTWGDRGECDRFFEMITNRSGLEDPKTASHRNLDVAPFHNLLPFIFHRSHKYAVEVST